MKRLILLSDSKGLSLIEVLLAIVILSVGILGVLRPMLSVAGVLNYIEERNEGSRVIRNKIWELEDEIFYEKKPLRAQYNETFPIRDRSFQYRVSTKPFGRYKGLYDAQLTLSWAQERKRKSVQRAFYLLMPYDEESS